MDESRKTAMAILTERGANPRVDTGVGSQLRLTIEVAQSDGASALWTKTGTSLDTLAQSALLVIEKAKNRWPVCVLPPNATVKDPVACLIDLLERDGEGLDDRRILAGQVIAAITNQSSNPSLVIYGAINDYGPSFTAEPGSSNYTLTRGGRTKTRMAMRAHRLSDALRKLL